MDSTACCPFFHTLTLAIVGEPTLMQLAIAEKGLVIFDGVVKGTPSHAAHPNNDNSIYNTIKVLEWFKNFSFEKVSEVLGEVKLTVTQINAGTQHNVVPAQVDLVIDVRVNDKYSNKEIADILMAEAPCTLTPRSLRLNSSAIDKNHPLVLSGIAMGRDNLRLPYPFRSGGSELPIVEDGARRQYPFAFRRRIHLYQGNRGGHRTIH